MAAPSPAPLDFASLRNQLELRGVLTAVTPLRIGGGRSIEPVGTDLPVVRDALGQPYVPGSSFKGALRGETERLLRALVPQGGACDPLNDARRCVRPTEWNDLVRRHERNEADLSAALAERLCMACSLYGAPWRAAKAQVADLPVIPASWLGHFEVRDGVGIERDTETAARGLKFDYEVVPASTQFALHLVCANAADWELGLLLLGLHRFETGQATLGGGVARGLGRVTLRWTGRSFFAADDPEAVIAYLEGRAEQAEPPERQWREALRAEIARRREVSS